MHLPLQLRLPNFRWLWLGQTFILTAAQFWVVSLTWLVLQKTGSGVAVGTVLMAAAIPRGLLMLVGGAISDRLPTQRVVIIAAVVNTTVIALLTGSLFADLFQLPVVMAAAALFGCAEAFLYPALYSLLPQLVSKARLGQANAWLQGSEQITNVLGPAAAGLVIGSMGLPKALAVNTLLFAIGSGLVCFLRPRQRRNQPQTDQTNLAGEILAGFRYAWQQADVRTSLLIIAMLNFAALGPMVIGVAELVNLRLGGSATTFGYLQSTYGIGALMGVGLTSRIPVMSNLRTPLVWLAVALGLCLMALGFVDHAWLAALVIASMGIGGGMIGVWVMTWLQQQTEAAMQGRMISLVMFASVALDPFSQAVSGMMLDINLTGLFVGAGGLMLLTALVSAGGKLSGAEQSSSDRG